MPSQVLRIVADEVGNTLRNHNGRGVSAPAARPPCPLCRLFSAAQQASRGDYPNAAPAGCGRGGGKDWHPLLEPDQAPGARVCSGYRHVSSATVWAEGALRPSLVPTWLAPDHCCHDRCVSHLCAFEIPFEISLPSLPKSPPPRPSPQGIPEALPSPILHRLSRLRYALLRVLRRAAAARVNTRGRCGRRRGGCGRRGKKGLLEFPGANGICGQCLRPPIEEAIKRLCNQFG
jgi:hypothetical protein